MTTFQLINLQLLSLHFGIARYFQLPFFYALTLNKGKLTFVYNLFHNRNTLNSFYLTPFFSTQYFTFCHTGQELLVLWRVHHLKYFGPYACISCQIGADVTFLIRGDLIQKLSCQVFGNYPRDQLSKFFVVPKISKYLEVLRSTDPFLINTRN